MADNSKKYEIVMTLVCLLCVCVCVCVCVCARMRARLRSDCIKSIPSFRFDRNEFIAKWFYLYRILYPHTPGSCKMQIP